MEVFVSDIKYIYLYAVNLFIYISGLGILRSKLEKYYWKVLNYVCLLALNYLIVACLLLNYVLFYRTKLVRFDNITLFTYLLTLYIILYCFKLDLDLIINNKHE